MSASITVTDADRDRFLAVATEVAAEAGAMIEDAFYRPKNIEFKGAVDIVTETDKAVEKHIIERFSAAFPDHKFIAEEGEASNPLTDSPTWIIDPVDGTTNFAHGYPNCCTSIGLVINKEIQVGIVFDPIKRELFHAVKGRGAFRNGEKIQVSEISQLLTSIGCYNFPYDRSDKRTAADLERIRRMLQAPVQGLRSDGSAAMSLSSVACGRVEFYAEIGLKCWDMAAGTLIVREAGGIVLSFKGSEFELMSNNILAVNNRALADILIPMLNDGIDA